jgi:hypothetical protein
MGRTEFSFEHGNQGARIGHPARLDDERVGRLVIVGVRLQHVPHGGFKLTDHQNTHDWVIVM